MVISFNEYMEYKEILPYYRNIQKEGILIGGLEKGVWHYGLCSS